MEGLTPQQKKFADLWVEGANQAQAYMSAYPGVKKTEVASASANRLLKNVKVSAYIAERQKQIESSKVANAAEVMEYFTSVMRGEIKDQFGLDAPLAERTKAAVEIAKRTVDVQSKETGGGVIIVNNIPRPESSKPD